MSIFRRRRALRALRDEVDEIAVNYFWSELSAYSDVGYPPGGAEHLMRIGDLIGGGR